MFKSQFTYIDIMTIKHTIAWLTVKHSIDSEMQMAVCRGSSYVNNTLQNQYFKYYKSWLNILFNL